MGTIQFQQFASLLKKKGRARDQNKTEAAQLAFAALLQEFDNAMDLVEDHHLFLLDEFWPEDLQEQVERFPESEQQYLKDLFHFYLVNGGIEAAIKELWDERDQLKISSIEFFTNACEIWEIARMNRPHRDFIIASDLPPRQRLLFYEYDPQTAQAIHNICKSLPNHNPGSPIRKLGWRDLLGLDRLIQLEKDKLLLDEMIDAFLHGGFVMEENEEYKISLVPETDKAINREKKRYLKNQYRARHYDYLSQDRVSEEPLFKAIDKKYKTNEGIVTFYVSKGLQVVKQAPNTTSIEVDESLFRDGNHDKLFELGMKANFYYYLRLSLRQNYWLTDELDTSKMEIQLPCGTSVPFSKISLILSAFSAKALNIEYLRYTITDKASMINLVLRKHLEKNPSEQLTIDLLVSLQRDMVGFEAKDLPENSRFRNFQYCCHPKEAMIRWLGPILELPRTQVESMLELLCNQEYGLSPLLYHHGDYYWYPDDFQYHLIPKYFYNYYWKNQQYSHKGNGQGKNKNAARNASSRSAHIALHLSRLFSNQKYLSAKAEVNYQQIGDSFKKRDVDVLVFDQKNNCFLAIEIKLSNTLNESYFKKTRWAEARINRKAKEQIGHTRDFFHSEGAPNWLVEVFDLDHKPIGFKLKHLLVTDNFYFDHQVFKIGDLPEDRVQIVSLFELQMILRGDDLLKPGSESWVRNELLRIRDFSTVSIPEEYLTYLDRRQQIEKVPKQGEKEFEEMVTFVKKNQIHFGDIEEGITLPQLVKNIRKDTLWKFLEDELKELNIKKSIRMISAPSMEMAF